MPFYMWVLVWFLAVIIMIASATRGPKHHYAGTIFLIVLLAFVAGYHFLGGGSA